ncbi:MAG: Holliday junction branch migration protein RuvA [bacterium]|nr:Holliday junction branch migration protein RuvA [bacterium]
MIGKLTGHIDSTGENWVLLDVNGVGYHVQCPAFVLNQLPDAGETVSLMIDTLVREDLIALYGFLDTHQKMWFQKLMTVQGVGARVAMALLSIGGVEVVLNAIGSQDKTTLCRADGVGPKLAARILNELKDKVGTLSVAANDLSGPGALTGKAENQNFEDAVSALVNLGYKRPEASVAVQRTLQTDPKASVETLIRAGLSELSQ